MQTAIIPVESFLDLKLAAEIWPENIVNSKGFLEQIIRRKKLGERLDNVVDHLPRPNVPLQRAIEQGRIIEQQAAELYVSLNELLDDQDYKRLILYLPFEFLPNKTWHLSEKKLRQALERFKQAYMEAWKSLLSTHDVRANFVDGDVLEIEQRVEDLPRVVKAAHLIPKLVEKGLMTVEDAITLMGKSDDQTLRDSINDALPDFTTRKPRVEAAFPNAQDYSGITEKRKKWLQEEKNRKTMEASARVIAAAIIENRATDDASIASQQTLIEGIRMAVESAESTDHDKAEAIYAHYKPALCAFWGSNDPYIEEALSKTFRRFHKLGIVDDNQLKELNIVIPKLAGPFSENLKFISKEVNDIRNIAVCVESNPELSQFIYPIFLLGGSRLKGYGNQNSDIAYPSNKFFSPIEKTP